jgi:hypothetical protein
MRKTQRKTKSKRKRKITKGRQSEIGRGKGRLKVR